MATEEEKNQALKEAAKLYSDRIAEADAKTDEDREREQLTAKANALSTEMREMYKQPTKYREELKGKESELNSTLARLEELGVSTNAPQRQGAFMHGGTVVIRN